MLTPQTDIVFKKIFATEANKDILISFINAVVSQEDQVANLTLANPYTIQNHRKSKSSILDINAVGTNGKRFNIEIQVNKEGDYDKRALFYWAKLYSEQLDNPKNKEYEGLMKTIGIHILNFPILPKSAKYHHTFYMTEKDTGLRYFTDIELHLIELTRFANPKNKIVHFMNNLDMWTGFLSQNNMLNPDKLPEGLDKAKLKKAIKVLDTMKLNEEERELYDYDLKKLRDEVSAIKAAKKEGQKEGKMEGKMEGHMEKSIEIAKKMLEENMPIDMIIKLTSLTKEQIEEIKL